ncbi:hypothetical protein PUNSTDRAFT_44953 [Punctularia strigosozonata HHB-11173 SS5]|uniref:uncharacterized protein n=1 Tax=Punctularia strigosozonata (strain HHB-11173) TaxID=741275 RepID=UPI000441871D|nr:uncharacterized protein PUNSTDRAFT_44953 [Punctularia strigosozonata HHB-11173 SS5]EIN08456.1 hypothetical protein PUNSTDRAFT_44953 [Punctularia strigosozonata HHB-11173 SS5]
MLITILPQELVDSVIDLVPEHELDHDNNAGLKLTRESVEDLRALSRVCRATRERSQKHLFQKLVINNPKYCRGLRTVLTANPCLSAYVKHIVVRSYDQRRSKALQTVINACRGLETLSFLYLDDFTRWPGACLVPSEFPALRRLEVARCTINNYDDIAEVLAGMPALQELHLSATCIERIVSGGAWTQQRKRLESLELRRMHCVVSGPDTTVAFTRGFQQVKKLDLTLHSSFDYDILRNLALPQIGVEHLTLAVDWYWAELPYDLCADFGDDPDRGTTFLSLTLQERPPENNFRMFFGGRWASRLLLAIPSTQLERVCVRLEYRRGGDPWDGFEWTAVDNALGCATRFPTLREVRVEIGERWAHWYEADEDPSLEDPFVVAVKAELPRVAERGILIIQ